MLVTGQGRPSSCVFLRVVRKKTSFTIGLARKSLVTVEVKPKKQMYYYCIALAQLGCRYEKQVNEEGLMSEWM